MLGYGRTRVWVDGLGLKEGRQPGFEPWFGLEGGEANDDLE